MTPFNLPICPCCTGAMLHTLAQNTGWLSSQSFLELGKGALLSTLGVRDVRDAKGKISEPSLASVPSPILESGQ